MGTQAPTTTSQSSPTATNIDSNSNTGPNLIVIIVPVVIVVLLLVALGVYFGRSKKKPSNSFSSTPITTISDSPPFSTPSNEANSSGAIAYSANADYQPLDRQPPITLSSNTVYNEPSDTFFLSNQVAELPINPRRLETIGSIRNSQPPLLKLDDAERVDQEPRAIEVHDQPPILKF
ncbi:hypothetical protein HK103_005126 [Boothiomyces macroporosus]|uniref:Uncharacterized protein n=1 Tax=Boothiomyces macroporosus TaxID=261099 RepID=A0AAD5UJ75_9FUNG|nr:hypothetical protein HK103_005126 [Boothiomyces macroporosus]